jgi:hypothetical protein
MPSRKQTKRTSSRRRMRGGSAPYPDYYGTATPASCSPVQPVINVPSCNEGLNPAPYAYGCGVGLGSSINYGSQDAFASRYFVGATASGGRRRSSPKRKTNKRSSQKKKLPKKGGAYYLGVEAPKVGGLAQIVPVYDPLKPAFSPRMLYDYPSPAYLTEPKLIDTGLKGGKRRSHRRKQRGGLNPAFLLPQDGTGPIPNDADLIGNFSPDMMTRSFNCHQPYWGPSCT